MARMQLAESKGRLWVRSVIKCPDCRRDPSHRGRSVATCALNLVTDESRSIWRILKVWIFCCQRGYMLLCVVPFLAPQLRLMDFKVWDILPAQSPRQVTVRHPGQKHVRVSFSEQWWLLLKPQRLARILSTNNGHEIFMSQQM